METIPAMLAMLGTQLFIHTQTDRQGRRLARAGARAGMLEVWHAIAWGANR